MHPRLVILLLPCLILAGCGFQLRGEAQLPAAMDRTYLEVADGSSTFARRLAMDLEASGVILAERPGSDTAVLRIHNERMHREALTITGAARVREFLLVFEIDHELLDPEGEVLIERESLRLTREYTFDEQEILAAQREREFLEDELSRAMSARLLRRLEAAAAP